MLRVRQPVVAQFSFYDFGAGGNGLNSSARPRSAPRAAESQTVARQAETTGLVRRLKSTYVDAFGSTNDGREDLARTDHRDLTLEPSRRCHHLNQNIKLRRPSRRRRAVQGFLPPQRELCEPGSGHGLGDGDAQSRWRQGD